jgi:hypothetical protein
MTEGYWHKNYFPTNFWHSTYWQIYGLVVLVVKETISFISQIITAITDYSIMTVKMDEDSEIHTLIAEVSSIP